jgi:hypothetical protein
MPRTKTKGQALTEFALILPILLLLLLGIIEGARIIWAYVQVQNAAREATRYAVTGQPWRRLGDAFDGDCALVEGHPKGDPWVCDDQERVARIKDVAFSYARGLGVDVEAGRNDTDEGSAPEYEAYANTAQAFGVMVKGQRNANDNEGSVNYPGRPGLNVLVQIYYNVTMLDPIYAAILPRDWVRINAQVVMQNEGVDVTASGMAPVGLGATPIPVGGGEDVPPGSSRVPQIYVAEAQPVPAGDDITIILEQHAPSTTYDVFFDDQLIGTVTTNAQFIAQLTYRIPVSTSPGEHSIHSEVAGADSVEASTPIEVSQPVGARIFVVDGSRWPAGSPITIGISGHDPGETYKIFFAGTQIGTIITDASGSGTLSYTIDPDQPEGNVFIESRTMADAPVADTQIVITSPDIFVQGGTVWPQGTRIFIFLRDHAANQTYSVYFGSKLVSSSATTNAIGEAILSYVIPSDTPDGTYVLRSEQSGATIAQIDIRVETPPYPFILIVGGYEWPAGSPITIQLRKHSANMSYDVYFGSNNVGRYTVDSNGDYTIAYIIPPTLSDGVYELRSVRTDNGNQEATVNVTVSAVPNITVDGGFVQAPGTTITIRLNQHAAHAAYDIYLAGTKIGTVITDSSGSASLSYTIPASMAPDDYLLESKPKDETTTVASATLTVLTPDLSVAQIDIPADFRVNTEIPVTVTIRNESDKAITNSYFDVDVYIDPVLEPTSGDNGLPPGTHKFWYNTIAANGTLTINDTVTLWGAEDHNVYARVDTSGNILESNEANNILGQVVASSLCGFESADTFDGSGPLPSAWLIQNYGDADPDGEAQLSSGSLVLHSKGETNWVSNDSGSRRGLEFVYQQEQVNGDFDVYVQVLSHQADNGSVSGKAGLEVRNSLDSQDVKLDWVIYQGSRLQAGQRSSYGAGMSQIGSYIYSMSMPVWLRIVRQGNEFSFYYATVSAVPPGPGDWMYAYSATLGNMGSTVYLGVMNASYVRDGASTSTFDNFRLCGDPAGALTCGEVKETGGAVFVDTRNYTDNVSRGGKSWVNVSRSGQYGMHVVDANSPLVDAAQAPTSSPELQYQVKFATAGRYYIALLGWAPDADSNSVHMGLNGSLTANTSDIGDFTTSSGAAPAWIRNTNWYIDVPSAGSYTLNLYMREDGAQVYKIALFQQADYPLEGFGPPQSECTATAPQDIPPGLTVCNQMLVNGDFEGDLLTEVYSHWTMAEQEMVGRTNVHYITPGTSFGVIMPSSDAGTGTPKQPWMYQEFVMSDWVLTTTTAILDLQKGVDWLGAPNDEPLYFYLRTAGGANVTDPVPIANGQDLPDLDPANYNNNSWQRLWSDLNGNGAMDAGEEGVDVLSYMLAAGYDPLNFAGQSLQVYFISPNSGSNTSEFYLDKITLNVCTTQPLPATIDNSLGGTTRVNQELTPGVTVWAYQMQSGSSAGGPVYTTYSIQNSTYHFYNLPAGTYLVYAEYFENNVRYTYQTTAVIPGQGNVTRDLNLVLP